MNFIPGFCCALWLLAAPATSPAGPPPQALSSPMTVAVLHWGDADSEIPDGRNGIGPGDGLPTSFLMDGEDRLYVLDAVGRRILADVRGDGSRARALQLGQTGLLGPKNFLVDFDRCSDGTFVVLDQVSGTVLRVAPSGEGKRRFGLIRAGTEIAATPDGRVLVQDAGLPAVDFFTAEGKFSKARKGAEWTPFADSRGGIYGARLEAPDRAALLRAADSGPPSVYAKIAPCAPGYELASAKIIGLDSRDRVYVQTIESLHAKWQFARLLRYDGPGRPPSAIYVPLPLEDEVSTLPRYFRATPKGDVLTFSTQAENGYTILKYSFPK